jgi:hypothetical protein
LKVPKAGAEANSTLDLDDPAAKDDILSLNQIHLPVGKEALTAGRSPARSSAAPRTTACAAI